MAKRVIRLTEQELSKVLSDILKMTGVFGGDKNKELKKTNDDSSLESEDSPLENISEKGQQLLSNPSFKEHLKEISQEIGVSENSIIKLMQHESGLNPDAKNSIGCVGLIQFCPDTRGGSTKTIDGTSYNLNDLQKNVVQQLQAIKEFWSKGKRDGKIKNAKDLYVYNFFPVAAGKSDDYVLQTKGLSAEKIARANPVFNKTLGRPIDTPLTVGDLGDYYQMKGMV